MKHNILYVMALVFVGLAATLASCEDSKEFNYFASKNYLQVETAIGIGGDVEGASSTATLNVKADCAWRVESTPSWLSVTPKEGTNDQVLTLTVTSSNNESDKRKGDIVIVMADDSKIKQTVVVTQEQSDQSLLVSPLSFLFDSSEDDDEIIITCADPWKITGYPDPNGDDPWLTLDQVEGSGNANVKIHVTNNEKTRSKTSVLTVTNTRTNKEVTVQVEQKEYTKSLKLDKSTIHFTKEGGDSLLEVNSSDAWSSVMSIPADQDQEWIVISPDKSDKGGRITLHATAKPNHTSKTRTAKLVISMDKDPSGYSETIEFTQDPDEFALNLIKPENSELVFAAVGRDKQKITVEASNEPKIEISSGFEASGVSHVGNEYSWDINTKEDNVSASTLEGKALITIEGSEEKVEIALTQEGMVYDMTLVEPADKKLTYTAEGGSSKIIVTATHKPEIEIDNSVFTTSEPAKSGDKYTYTISVGKNTSTQFREGNATLMVKDNNGKVVKSVQIALTQEATVYTLKVEPETLTFTPYASTKVVTVTTNSSNLDFKFSDDCSSWLSYKVNGQNYEFTVKDNYSTTEHSVKGIFSIAEMSKPVEVTIKQEAMGEFLLITSSVEYTFDQSGTAVSPANPKVTINASRSWIAEPTVSWIHVADKTDNGFIIKVDASAETTARQGEIHLSLTGSTDTKVIKVTQTAGTMPTVSAVEVSNVTKYEAVFNASYTQTPQEVTAYGFEYSTSANFSNSVNVKAQSASTAFSVTVSGLSSATKYYVKAYAVNPVGKVESEVVEFTTAGSVPGSEDNVPPSID